jgi:hypothetical protein
VLGAVVKAQKRILLVGVPSVFCIAYLVAHEASSAEMATTSVRPFMLRQIQYKKTEMGEQLLERDEVVRRQDGARVILRQFLSPSGTVAREAKHYEFPDGRSIEASPAAKAKTTYTRSVSEIKSVGRLINSDSLCILPVETLLAKSTFFSRATLVVSYVHTDDPLQRDLDVRLPDFKCQIVDHQEQYRKDANSPWQTRVGTRVEDFQEKAPPDDWFTDENGFAEMKPSEERRQALIAAHADPNQCSSCIRGMTAADERYAKNHRSNN